VLPQLGYAVTPDGQPLNRFRNPRLSFECAQCHHLESVVIQFGQADAEATVAQGTKG